MTTILTGERRVCLKLSVVKGQLCHFPRTSRAEMGSYVHDTCSLHKTLSTEFQQHLYVISVSDWYCPGLITNSSQTHSSETTLWTAPGVRQNPLLSKLESWVESQDDIETPPFPSATLSFFLGPDSLKTTSGRHRRLMVGHSASKVGSQGRVGTTLIGLRS